MFAKKFKKPGDKSEYKNNFKILDLALGEEYPRSRGELIKPTNFTVIIDMAETLASEQPFLRVDFYDIGRPTPFPLKEYRKCYSKKKRGKYQ